MKIEWLVADVITPVVTPDRIEHDILRGILGFFWPSGRTCGQRVEPLCGVGTPSWALITLLRIIY